MSPILSYNNGVDCFQTGFGTLQLVSIFFEFWPPDGASVVPILSLMSLILSYNNRVYCFQPGFWYPTDYLIFAFFDHQGALVLCFLYP